MHHAAVVPTLLAAVARAPVSIAVQANQPNFQLYSGGIMTGNCGAELDHGVVAVGYGTDNGVDYWKVKNSWGTQWGEAGYFRVIRNKGVCGIGKVSDFPTGVARKRPPPAPTAKPTAKPTPPAAAADA